MAFETVAVKNGSETKSMSVESCNLSASCNDGIFPHNPFTLQCVILTVYVSVLGFFHTTSVFRVSLVWRNIRPVRGPTGHRPRDKVCDSKLAILVAGVGRSVPADCWVTGGSSAVATGVWSPWSSGSGQGTSLGLLRP